MNFGSPARAAGLVVAFIVAYLICSEFSEALHVEAGVSPWFPAVGLSLAAVLLAGRNAIPVVIVADAVQLSVREPEFGAVAVVAMACTQGAVWGTAGLVLRRLLPRAYRDLRVVELWRLTFIGVVLASLASALLGVPVLIATQDDVPWADYAELARRFFIGDAVGVLTAAPALLALAAVLRGEAGPELRRLFEHRRESAAMLVATIVAPAIGVLGIEQEALPLAALPVAWVALRRGIIAASGAVLVWSVAGALSYHLGDSTAEFTRIAALMTATGLLALFTGVVVSERERARDRLAFLATHDDTGLLNLDGFRAALAAELATGPERVSVVSAQATRLGELVADGPEVLTRTLHASVGRLKSVAPPGTTLARLAPGLLALMLRDHDEAALDAFAARLVDTLEQPLEIDGREYLSGPAVGSATGQPGDTPDALLARAAQAAAAATPVAGGMARFDDRMRARDQAERELAADLQQAMADGHDGLSLHYQPIVELTTGEILGAEALLRWRHPVRGNVPPADFIPIAERRGLILPLGRWILETACRDAGAWPQVGSAPLMVEVNLSPVQLRADGLIADVLSTLETTGFAPERLRLELTEGAVVEDFELAVARVQSLCDAGVQVVLDDFGTGHSSMRWLQRLPVRSLKIDRSFVSGVDSEAVDLAIVTATIGLARAMHLDVVAEGVETPAQLAALRRLRCQSIQGYLVSRPVPDDEFRAWLAEHAAGPIAR